MNQNDTLFTISKVTAAPPCPEGQSDSLTLRGKWLKNQVAGGLHKKVDGQLVWYSGDLVLSHTLPDVGVSKYLPEGLLTPAQLTRLDIIIANEQDVKLRQRAKELTFGSSTSFQMSELTLSGITTIQRTSDSLKLSEINELIGSSRWIKAAMTYAGQVGISAKGWQMTEQLIKSCTRSGSQVPQTWETVRARFDAVKLAIEAAIAEDLLVTQPDAPTLQLQASLGRISTQLANNANGLEALEMLA